MISALQKQPDGTIKLTITIPSSDVKKAWDDVVNDIVKITQIPGFRKGMAPTKLIEGKIDKEKIKDDVLKNLLPKYYIDAIKEHNLTPIINPKIHIDPASISIDLSKDWQFEATTCEAPNVNLNNYKENIKKLTAKTKIIVPGKERTEVKFEDIVRALTDSITVTIPEILLTQEVDRLLAQTLDEIKRLGLTLDQYLAASGKTPQLLREEYQKKAKIDIALELALEKIAEEEKITVEPKEIDEAIQKAKDPTERKNLENNRYVLANILRQQKTLDFLKNL